MLGEPVDVATGEYILPATDATFPGLTRLALTRVHRSKYDSGIWFGKRWASTFDARALIADDVVVTVDADGTMLRFDRPEGGNTSTPARGRGWQLTQTEVGGYRLYSVDQKRSYFFDPKPVLEGSDARAGEFAISAILDRHRNRISFEYDDTGAPTAIESTDGYRVEIATAGSRIVGYRLAPSVLNPKGRPLRSFGYAAGNLASVTDSVGATTEFIYDGDDRMVAWVDSLGQRFDNNYDTQGRVVSQSGEDGVWAGRFEYRDMPGGGGEVTSYTDAVGNTTRYGIDNDGRVRQVADPLGRITEYDFNDNRDLLEVRTPDGHRTRYVYAASGDVGEIIAPDNAVTWIRYVAPRYPMEIQGPDGGLVRLRYNDAGDVVERVDEAGGIERREFNSSGAVTALTDSAGRRTRFVVNGAGLTVESVDALGHSTRYDYDDRGLVIAITRPDGARTQIGYDGEGRITRSVDPAGAQATWTYDGEGNCIEAVDEVGAARRWVYGFYDKPTSRIDPDGSRTDYLYDAARRLTAVVNPQGMSWDYQYAPDGQLAAESDFGGARTSYVYDSAGRLGARVNGAGQAVVFAYDAAGRVMAEKFARIGEGGMLEIVEGADGREVRYDYDAAGRLSRGQTADVELEVERDAMGRPVSERWDAVGVAARWNPAGDIVGMRYASGLDVAVDYDVRGAPAGIVAGGQAIAFDSDVCGREVRRQFGSVAVNSVWDASGRLAERSVVADVEPVGTLRLGGVVPQERRVAGSRVDYRADGMLTRVGDVPGLPGVVEPVSVGLDVMGRVTERVRSADGAVESFGYDSAGNLAVAESGRERGLGVRPWRFERGRLVDDGRARLSYDGAGRLVMRVVRRLGRKPDVWRYRWDAWDRLVGVVTPDGVDYVYGYDVVGRRVSKVASDGMATRFWWCGDKLVEQAVQAADGMSAVTSWVFVPGERSPVAQVTGGGRVEKTVSVERDGLALEGVPVAEWSQDRVDREFFALVSDQVGLPVAVVDPGSGEVVGRARASLWGEVRWEGASTPIRFPGQYADAESGLCYNLFRYYDPGAGRFVSPDPLGLAPAPNPYMYPPNPTRWCDPWGLVKECEGDEGTPGIDPQAEYPPTTHGLGVNDPPQRYHGPWTQPDMYRMLHGSRPFSYGDALELHHADQMPGSAIHEVGRSEHMNKGVHQNKIHQGVTNEMRVQDRRLHWMMRALELGLEQRRK